MYEDIQEKIRRKGWGLYDAGSELEQNLFKIVPKGSVTSMEKNKNYIILPHIAQTTNTFAMQRALEDMQLQRVFPIVKYKQLTISAPAFIILEDGVKVYSKKSILFSFDDFLQCLDTLVDRTMN